MRRCASASGSALGLERGDELLHLSGLVAAVTSTASRLATTMTSSSPTTRGEHAIAVDEAVAGVDQLGPAAHHIARASCSLTSQTAPQLPTSDQPHDDRQHAGALGSSPSPRSRWRSSGPAERRPRQPDEIEVARRRRPARPRAAARTSGANASSSSRITPAWNRKLPLFHR